MKKSILIFSTMLLMLSQMSCDKDLIFGSGNIVTSDRSMNSFDKITNFGPIDIKIMEGNTQQITVHGDDNVIEHILTRVVGGTLEIKLEDNLSFSSINTRVTVIIPTIVRVRNLGSGNIDILNFNMDFLHIENSGSGNIDGVDMVIDNCEIKNHGSGDLNWVGFYSNACSIWNDGSGDYNLQGEVDDFNIRNNGSGNVKTYRFDSKNSDVVNSGSGNVKVFCTKNLGIKNRGSGNVYFKGDASVVSSNSGSGNIINVN